MRWGRFQRGSLQAESSDTEPSVGPFEEIFEDGGTTIHRRTTVGQSILTAWQSLDGRTRRSPSERSFRAGDEPGLQGADPRRKVAMGRSPTVVYISGDSKGWYVCSPTPATPIPSGRRIRTAAPTRGPRRGTDSSSWSVLRGLTRRAFAPPTRRHPFPAVGTLRRVERVSAPRSPTRNATLTPRRDRLLGPKSRRESWWPKHVVEGPWVKGDPELRRGGACNVRVAHAHLFGHLLGR